jgi:tRNA-modifying protein YgfZ
MLSPDPVTFKANRTPDSLSRLPGHSILAVEGPDSGAFLQAQTMNDVSALAPGSWQWNGWLNAKGRVIALFALLHAEPGLYLAVLPDFAAPEFRDRLQRFVFRSKVALRHAEEFSCASRFPAEAPALDSRDTAQGDRRAGWLLDMSGDATARHLLVLPSDDAALAPPDDDANSQWFDLDLAHGLPRLGPDQVEAWTPQMLSLDRLRAFSLKKGCYPGQEIVARTHYLGKARRGLARLEGVDLEVGLVVRNRLDEQSGQVICVSPDRAHALAVVQLDHADQLIRAGEKAVTALALSTGLQRPV